jgi:hypothetical protein
MYINIIEQKKGSSINSTHSPSFEYVCKFSCSMIGIVVSQYITYIETFQRLLDFLKQLISLSFKINQINLKQEKMIQDVIFIC